MAGQYLSELKSGRLINLRRASNTKSQGGLTHGQPNCALAKTGTSVLFPIH
jgi:hypothetical protein